MNVCSSSIFHLSYAHKSGWRGFGVCVFVCVFVCLGRGAGDIRLAVWGSVCLRVGGGGVRNLRPLWSCGDKRRSTWDSGTCRLGLPAHLLYLLHELLALRAQPAASCHCRPHPVSLTSSRPLRFSSPVSFFWPLYSPSPFTPSFLSHFSFPRLLSHRPLCCVFLLWSVPLSTSLTILPPHSQWTSHSLSFVILSSPAYCCLYLLHSFSLDKPDFQVSFMGNINCKCTSERERWRDRAGFGLLGGAKMPHSWANLGHHNNILCFLF